MCRLSYEHILSKFFWKLCSYLLFLLSGTDCLSDMSYSSIKHSSEGLSRASLVLFLTNSINFSWLDNLWSQRLTTEITARMIRPMMSNIAYSTHHLEVIYGNSADSVASITLECSVCLKIESIIDLKSGHSIWIVYWVLIYILSLQFSGNFLFILNAQEFSYCAIN